MADLKRIQFTQLYQIDTQLYQINLTKFVRFETEHNLQLYQG